jgi:hypothetical protein
VSLDLSVLYVLFLPSLRLKAVMEVSHMYYIVPHCTNNDFVRVYIVLNKDKFLLMLHYVKNLYEISLKIVLRYAYVR